VHSQV